MSSPRGAVQPSMVPTYHIDSQFNQARYQPIT